MAHSGFTRDIDDDTVANDVPPPPGWTLPRQWICSQVERHWHQVQALSEKEKMTISDKRATYRNTLAHIDNVAPSFCQSCAPTLCDIPVSFEAYVSSGHDLLWHRTGWSGQCLGRGHLISVSVMALQCFCNFQDTKTGTCVTIIETTNSYTGERTSQKK